MFSYFDQVVLNIPPASFVISIICFSAGKIEHALMPSFFIANLELGIFKIQRQVLGYLSLLNFKNKSSAFAS